MEFTTRRKEALLFSSGTKPFPLPLPTVAASAVLHNCTPTTTTTTTSGGGGVGGGGGGRKSIANTTSTTSSLLEIAANDALHSLHREILSSSSSSSSSSSESVPPPAVRFFDLKNIFHRDVYFRVKVRSCCRKCILVCPVCGKLSPGATVKVRFCLKKISESSKPLAFQRDIMIEATVIPPLGFESILGCLNSDMKPSCQNHNMKNGLKILGGGDGACGVRKRVSPSSSSSASSLLSSSSLDYRENPLKRRRASFIYTPPPLEDLKTNAAAAAAAAALQDRGRRNESKSTTIPITTTEAMAVAVSRKTKPKKQVRFADPVESVWHYV